VRYASRSSFSSFAASSTSRRTISVRGMSIAQLIPRPLPCALSRLPLSLRLRLLRRRISGRGISWAMDIPRTEMVRRDVELAANELNELREAYRTQLAAIRDERETIADALRQLHLKEDSLRHREDELHHTHQQLEGKELHYRNKGGGVVSNVEVLR
jgi:outer membrane protein TolC